MTGATFWAKESSYIRRIRKAQDRLLTGSRYQRAFVDFFEDQLVQYSYDWKKMLEDYLFGGEQPLINNFIAGCKFVEIVTGSDLR